MVRFRWQLIRHPGHDAVVSAELPEGLTHYPDCPLPNLRLLLALAWMAPVVVSVWTCDSLFFNERVSIEPRAVQTSVVGRLDRYVLFRYIVGPKVRSTQWDKDRGSVLGRALVVLDAFENENELRLTELANRTGLPKATAHRIVAQLVERQWLERDGSHVRLGVRVFELGSFVSYHREFREAAVPFMADLFEATHEAVHLAVRAGLDVLYIEKINGHRMLPVPTRVGGRMPLHCTGLGKAMLAYASDQVLDAVIQRGLPQRTLHTITNPDQLRRELLEVRRTGVAFDMEESAYEIRCVAAPVFGVGNQLGAISVTVSTRRPLQPAQLAPAVRTAALGVSSVLGGSRPPHFATAS